MFLEPASASVHERMGPSVNCRLKRTGALGGSSALQAGKHLSNVHLLTLTYMASGSRPGPQTRECNRQRAARVLQLQRTGEKLRSQSENDAKGEKINKKNK